MAYHMDGQLTLHNVSHLSATGHLVSALELYAVSSDPLVC